MEKTFICVGSDQGEMFLNPHQIVRAIYVDKGEFAIHLSDGSCYRITGDEAIGKLINLLAEDAINLDGELLTNMAARIRASESKLTLVKPKD